MDRKQAVLFVNQNSRRGKEWFEPVRDKLKAEGLELLEAKSFNDAKSMLAAIKKAVGDKVPLIAVGGGDGTLQSAAKEIAHTESVLGVLPLGTGNSFARDLEIVADIDKATDVLIHGKVTEVDCGTINDTYFLNVATVGLTTRIAVQLNGPAKRKLGRFVYAVAIFRALAGMRPFHIKIITPSKTLEFDTLQLVIGSGRFHAGPFPLSPDASITDGKLNVYALADTRPSALLKYALFLPGGHHTQLEEVKDLELTGGRVETSPIRRVTVDGEIKVATPFKFGIEARALKVMVPRGFAG